MGRTTVDNAGQGNCMYHAYSISLMYYLLNKRDKVLSEKIFNKLFNKYFSDSKIDDAEKQKLILAWKTTLHALLDDKQLTSFSGSQITGIIEKVLTPVVRKVAAQQIKENFIANAAGTNLFTSANYGMLSALREKALAENENEFAAAIRSYNYAADGNEANQKYMLAEIYKFNVNNPHSLIADLPALKKEFDKHIEKNYKRIVEQYKAEWPALAEKIYPRKIEEFKAYLSKDFAGNHAYFPKDHAYTYQQQFIGELLAQGKIDFPKLIQKFTTQWEVFIDKAYAARDKSKDKGKDAVTKENLKANPAAQHAFLQQLYTPKKIDVDEFIDKYPAEWEAYVTKLASSQNKSKEAIRLDRDHKLQFREEMGLPFKTIIAGHVTEWEARITQIIEVESPVIKRKVDQDKLYNDQLVSKLMRDVTISFFTANDNARLKEYEMHINTNYRWGTEDALLELHAFVEGQRKIRDPISTLVHIEYDTSIPMAIYANGVPKSGAETPEMILNNLYNAHWVSLVKEASPVLDTSLSGGSTKKGTHTGGTDPVALPDGGKKGTTKTGANTGGTDPDVLPDGSKKGTTKTGANTGGTDPVVLPDGSKKGTVKTGAPTITGTGSTPILPAPQKAKTKSQKELREDLLVWCGFNDYMHQLQVKAEELAKTGYKDAAKQAHAILNSLNDTKAIFLAEKSTMTVESFSQECKNVITKAEKSELEKHRGIGKIFNGMLNALVYMANAFISLSNLLGGKYKLIDPNLIATESINHVNRIGESVADIDELQTSLSALMTMRKRSDKKQQSASAPLDSSSKDDSELDAPTLPPC